MSYIGWDNGHAVIESEAGVPGVAYGYDMADHRAYTVSNGDAWGNKSYALFYCVEVLPQTAPESMHYNASNDAWEMADKAKAKVLGEDAEAYEE